MDAYLISVFLLIFTLSILLIALYVWVFTVEPLNPTNENNSKLLGLENMSVENYLIPSDVNQDLLTFYEKPSNTDPYIEISYIYQNTPDLHFGVKNKSGSTVNTSDVILSTTTNNNGNTFVQRRIYFKNLASDYYTLFYNLDDTTGSSDNVEILRLELKV